MIKVLVEWDNEDGSTFHCNAAPGQQELDQVRQDFNPSGDDAVSMAKVLAASFMTLTSMEGQDGRLTAMARSEMEIAAMLAVKSMTAKKG